MMRARPLPTTITSLRRCSSNGLVGGVGVGVGHLDRVAAADFEDAVAGDRAGRGVVGMEPSAMRTLRPDRVAVDGFLVAALGRAADLDLFAGRQDGEVLVVDLDVEAPAGLDLLERRSSPERAVPTFSRASIARL